MKKLSAIIFAIIFVIFGILLCGEGSSPIVAEAAEGGASITISDTSAYQGDYVYLYVRANNFVNIASLELSIVYDADVFEFRSVQKSSLMPSDAVTSENSDTAGMVGLYAVSTNGITGSGNLWYITLYVKSNATVGSHPVQVLAGECVDSALNPVSVTTSNCNITVNKREQQVHTISMYSSISRSNLQQGDDVMVTFYTYELYGLAAAEMEVEYDKSLLSLNSATLGCVLNQSDSISSINTDTAGYIKISYADMNGVTGFANPFLTLSFTAKSNVDAQTSVSLSLGGLNDADLNPIVCDGATATLSLKKMAEEVVLPSIFVSSISDMGDSCTVNVVAEGGTGLAAGDFIVSYDATLIECTSAVGNENYLVVIDKKIKDGQVRFSFVAENGILEDTTLISLTFTKIQETPSNATISVSGSNLVDSEIQPIEVAYQSCTISLHSHTWGRIAAKSPTCTDFGWNEYEKCSVCNEIRGYEQVPALGHDVHHFEAQAPTCTEVGWNAYDTCDRCDYTTYAEIAALGHKASTAVVEHRVEPTCTTNGSYDEVVYCSVCSIELSRDSKVIPAQHAWGEWSTIIAPTCTEKGKEQRVCNNDPKHKETRDIAALGHDAIHHGAQAPTCTGKGWNAYDTCSRCEYTTYVEIAPLGHDIHHHNAQSPTCTEEGWDAYDFCSRCDYSTYSGIAALGHEIQHHSAKEPICTESGWNAYDTCDRCDYSTYTELPALGHHASDWIVDEEPTDTSVGHKHKECTVCGDVLAQEDIEVLQPKEDKPNLDWLLWGGIGVGCIAVAVLVVVITHKKRKK